MEMPGCEVCGKALSAKQYSRCMKHKIVSEDFKRKLSLRNRRLGIKPPSYLGKKRSQEDKERIGRATKARWADPEGRVKMQKALTGVPKPSRRGANNLRWKGGITPLNRQIRGSLEYKQWRRAVFERDKFTCQLCGQVGGDLHVDHIKPFSKYPELRFELTNGRVLCKPCHSETDTYCGKVFTKK